MFFWSYPTFFFFFFNDTATTEIYTLSLHDALPISRRSRRCWSRPRTASRRRAPGPGGTGSSPTSSRSGEHTSELQSPCNLVCRLLLEKKKKRHLLLLFSSVLVYLLLYFNRVHDLVG